MYEEPALTYSTSTSGSLDPTALLFIWVFVLVVLGIMFASMWKIFTKAGKPGWAALVPIYNIIVMLEVVGRPAWWIVLCFVPLANIVVGIIIVIDLAKVFGKSTAFAIFGLIIFSYIGYPMLAFGKAEYQGTSTSGLTPPAPPAVSPPAKPAV